MTLEVTALELNDVTKAAFVKHLGFTNEDFESIDTFMEKYFSVCEGDNAKAFSGVPFTEDISKVMDITSRYLQNKVMETSHLGQGIGAFLVAVDHSANQAVKIINSFNVIDSDTVKWMETLLLTVFPDTIDFPFTSQEAEATFNELVPKLFIDVETSVQRSCVIPQMKGVISQVMFEILRNRAYASINADGSAKFAMIGLTQIDFCLGAVAKRLTRH